MLESETHTRKQVGGKSALADVLVGLLRQVLHFSSVRVACHETFH